MGMEFISQSGARVVINTAPWKDAKELKRVLETASIGTVITPDFSEHDFPKLTDLILRVDSSEAFDRALWPCLIRCTRNDEKIVESTFDKEDARKDYYEIIAACLKVNLAPLVESLFSQFAALLPAKDKKENAPASQ